MVLLDVLLRDAVPQELVKVKLMAAHEVNSRLVAHRDGEGGATRNPRSHELVLKPPTSSTIISYNQLSFPHRRSSNHGVQHKNPTILRMNGGVGGGLSWVLVVVVVVFVVAVVVSVILRLCCRSTSWESHVRCCSLSHHGAVSPHHRSGGQTAEMHEMLGGDLLRTYQPVSITINQNHSVSNGADFKNQLAFLSLFVHIFSGPNRAFL